MPFFFYSSDITIQRYTLWALYYYMYGTRMHIMFLPFHFLACAFPLSQRYRMRFGSVTLGCGRESCRPSSLFFFLFCFFVMVSDGLTADTHTVYQCSTCLSTDVVAYRTLAVNGTGSHNQRGKGLLRCSGEFWCCVSDILLHACLVSVCGGS